MVLLTMQVSIIVQNWKEGLESPNNILDIPEEKSGDDVRIPYYIVGDNEEPDKPIFYQNHAAPRKQYLTIDFPEPGV